MDRERVLAKLDALDGYVRELAAIAPRDRASYWAVEKRRACERLLQIAVEAVIDICHLLVAGHRLGLPAEEDDVLDKLERAAILPPHVVRTVREMKGCRNILVHEYGDVDDAIIFEIVTTRRGDFTTFKQAVLAALTSQ